MRAGGYTVHQSLTAEAATALKLSLGLARRRGHAQVTPLHVAYTLLGSSSSPSPSPAYGLLRRACARSHRPVGACAPPHYYSHQPPQCRALELCFNVALNRLPTANAVASGSPSSSSSSASSTSFAASILHQTSPTLSNALVAALKRAQANQRRGCVELQTQPPSPPATPSTTTSSHSQQQQQPMLMIRVELDQLIISILDDPSVSRVMREAGFSSAAVKNNLEEESNAIMLAGGHGHHPVISTPSPSPAEAPPVPSQSFLEPYACLPTGYGGDTSWPAPFFNYQPQADVEFELPCKEKEEDVRAILDVMMTSRKPGRSRTNPVVVADSVSVAEASVAGLMRRLERGLDIPDELRGARVLRLHLSHAHVRLMTRADVDASVADLRRTIAAATDAEASGLVIYVGDMRWAVVVDDDDVARVQATPSGFSQAEYMVAELARLLGELRAGLHGQRAWLVAVASYGTYMRCQRLSMEETWALQPVSVPTGGSLGLGLGLALGPRASTSETDGNAAQHAQFPLLDFSPREEDGTPVMCTECTRNYEIEALAVRAKAEGTSLALSFFPGWPQADEPQTSPKDDLMDLKRRWSRLCQRVHTQRSQPTRPSNATAAYSNLGLCLSFETTSETKHHQDVKTTLSLLPPDRSDDIEANQAASQGPDTMVSSRDMKNVLRLWPDDERPSGDLKRKVGDVELPRESKRWRGSCCLDLNLNLCASSEDELAASDLTNDGEASGDASVTGSLDSHC